jgi:hypothetical protein
MDRPSLFGRNRRAWPSTLPWPLIYALATLVVIVVLRLIVFIVAQVV